MSYRRPIIVALSFSTVSPRQLLPMPTPTGATAPHSVVAIRMKSYGYIRPEVKVQSSLTKIVIFIIIAGTVAHVHVHVHVHVHHTTKGTYMYTILTNYMYYTYTCTCTLRHTHTCTCTYTYTVHLHVQCHVCGCIYMQ